MISLYPSHIHISFTYPYISHIHKSFIIFACYPATCVFFIFVALGRGVFFLWFFGVGVVDVFRQFFVSPFVSLFASSRPSFRLPFRHSARFPVSLLAPPFGPSHRFVSPFGRVGWAVCGSRRFCQLFRVGGRLFLFRVLVSWRRCGGMSYR